MGELIRSFTFGRNALKRTAAESAEAVMASLKRAEEGVDLTTLKRDDNGAYNVIRDLITFCGVLVRENGSCRVTRVGQAFARLYAQNPEDAWRWLITRSLWLYVVPNGTGADVNDIAAKLQVRFEFFRSILGLLTHLYSQPDSNRFLYYEELCAVLNDDSAWGPPPSQLFSALLERRGAKGSVGSGRILLGDLEDEYDIGRDNLHTVFNKAFLQTGLFEYAFNGKRVVGIALSSKLDRVLQARIRCVLDNSVSWDSGEWPAFLDLKTTDLPEEVSLQITDPPVEAEPDQPINQLLLRFNEDLQAARLQLDEALVHRFVAALLTKRFAILTGLSGSGKTKLAQAFAAWLCPRRTDIDVFPVGAVIPSDKVEYRVTAADSVGVELDSSTEGGRALVPRALVREWVDCIRANGFTRETPARKIREAVAETTQYSGQLNSFETQLKAAAFAVAEAVDGGKAPRGWEIVAVGADWTSKENSLGYPDALNPGRYVRTTPILDLLLRARTNTEVPHFLVLDEMNLSHVERYFGDFLSALESGEQLALHADARDMSGVPPAVELPANLYIVGTVNVDETTYMFSPKVLDRANSIEFRVDRRDMSAFAAGFPSIDLHRLEGRGAAFAKAFVLEGARADVTLPDGERVRAELMLLFDVLGRYGAEFGFRTSREIARFIHFHEKLSTAGWKVEDAFDAQVCQKILPKLNGSRRRLEPLLCALGVLCCRARLWDSAKLEYTNGNKLFDEACAAASLEDEKLHPILNEKGFLRGEKPIYPVSFGKIRRMLERSMVEGFASFAEA